MGNCESTPAPAAPDAKGEEPAAPIDEVTAEPLWKQEADASNAVAAAEEGKVEQALSPGGTEMVLGEAGAEDVASPEPEVAKESEGAKKEEDAAKALEESKKKEEEDAIAAAAAAKKEVAKKQSEANKKKKRATSPKKAAAKAVAPTKAADAPAEGGEAETKAEEKEKKDNKNTEEKKEEKKGLTLPLEKAQIREREKAFKAKAAKEQETLGAQIRAAAKSNDAARVTQLLEDGVVPSVIDKDGWTPLMVAAQDGATECCTVLLQYGADPKAVIKLGEYGMTALHYAARKGHVETAKVLAPVSDLSLKNHQGRTAKEVAKAEGHAEIVKLCRSKPKAAD